MSDRSSRNISRSGRRDKDDKNDPEDGNISRVMPSPAKKRKATLNLQEPMVTRSRARATENIQKKTGTVIHPQPIHPQPTHQQPINPQINHSQTDYPQINQPQTSNFPTYLTPVPQSQFNQSAINRTMNINAGEDQRVASVRAAFDHTHKQTKDERGKVYMEAHGALLKTENASAWDREASHNATDVERKASVIVRAIREFERSEVFGNKPSELLPGPETLDMGGQFLTNKERIETRSLLFRITKRVPKGALLHLHFNAELSPERLLDQAKNVPNMFIRSIRPLRTQTDLDLTEMVFNVMPANTRSVNIFSAHYQGDATNHKATKNKEANPNIWMRWSEFQDAFKNIPEFKEKYAQYPAAHRENVEKKKQLDSSESGPVELGPAEIWLLQKMVLSEEEAYSPQQTVNGVWARFNQATRCFKGLLNYESVYEWYIGNAIDRLIDEKVMYAELRPMLMDKSIPSTDGTRQISNADQMRMIEKVVRMKKEQLIGENRPNDFPFGLKIIYCTPRSIPTDRMETEVRDCLDLKVRFPDLICGFDLVGAEDRPNHIGFYHDALSAFKQTCKDHDLDIPFLFHAGETLLDTGGSETPENSNLYDAVVLGSKRIGHGFSLLKHPDLVEKFRKTDTQPGICIELCPISNELLHLCRNIKEHPFPELLAAGIPCTVNSDNPSLFSNSMSFEFYQIMVGAPTMSIFSWKQLALWSIEYSCLTNEQKQQGYVIFLDRWAKFCTSVVESYGHLLKPAETARAQHITLDNFGIPLDNEKGRPRWNVNENKLKNLYTKSGIPLASDNWRLG